MNLAESFPQNPFQPTLRYVAKTQLPILMPWTNEPIKLGTPFSFFKAGNGNPMSGRNPFSEASTAQNAMIFRSNSRGSVNVTSSGGERSASEHTKLSITGQVGFSWLGASGRANYEKSASQDSNAIKSSHRFDYSGGSITFAQAPQLSPEASNLLFSSSDPHAAFRERFGDYYVGGYIIGGANASMVSGSYSGSSSSEDISGEFTLQFLFWSEKKNFESHESNSSFNGTLSIVSFDSLDDKQENRTGNDRSTYSQILRSSVENQVRGADLTRRVTKKAEAMGIKDGDAIIWDKCDELCRNGLVAELLLLPYSGLRSYVAAVMSRLS